MIEYKKIQSNGNNFLLLDNRGLHYDAETLNRYTVRDCDIKKGIGADGMLVIEPSDSADFKMRIINANGFESEMCGNGARCIALYAYEKGIADIEMSFETLAGLIRAEVSDNRVKIGMGTYSSVDSDKVRHLVVDEQQINFQYMEVGVPHVVVFWEDNFKFDRNLMIKVGRAFDTNHDVFPRGTNVNFVRKLDENSIEVITYERGVEDITDSCGTGSCASAVLSSKRYGMTSPIDAVNIGGINTVHFEFEASKVNIDLEGFVYYSGDIRCASLPHRMD